MNERRKSRDLSDAPIFWVVTCGLAMLIGGVLLWQVDELWARRILRGHMEAQVRARTRGMLRMLAVSAKLAVDLSGKQPPDQMHLLLDFCREHCPAALKVAEEDSLGSQPGLFVDSWGSPVRLIVESPTRYKLISFGANRMDEGGAGDDISYGFNPKELDSEADGFQ